MSASTTDKITDVRNAARPTSARVTVARTVAATTLSCNGLIGWPTASKVHFVTYQIDSNSNPIAGTQLDCSGIVSGTTITSMTVVDGVDGGNSVGDVVEMLPTAGWGQDLADALTTEHSRTGAHSAALVTTLKSTILGAVYPVGSVYASTVSTNPATLLGFGTWTAYGAGRVMVGVGTSDQAFAAGATGGESTHILTTNEMPSHNHTFNTNVGVFGNHNYTGTGFNPISNDVSGVTINNTGGGTAHNNLQPYIVTYLWNRTA